MEAKRQKINVTLPTPMVERLEAERAALSQRAGCGVTASQTIEALLGRALDGHRNNFHPVSAGN
ncbi:hypothetical protein ACNRBH_23810 [Ralstonia pseudosolanacearum]|uniref:hypothetical protein n=1 Tax=Ralstonia pseudosolanacearum TaxID=1310165 RepID=UPI003AB063C5